MLILSTYVLSACGLCTFACILMAPLPQLHPNGYTVATASEDETCRLFDLRSDQQLISLGSGSVRYSSTGLSASCRLVIAGAEDASVHLFDCLKGSVAGECRIA